MKVRIFHVMLLCVISGLTGCSGVNTFPTIARAGDTVAVMIGGSEQASMNNVSVQLTDAAGQSWDLQEQGLVRSVFNLRPDGRAQGLHYSGYLDGYISWAFGHEPLQTVLVTDLPVTVAPGPANLTIALTGVTDNSAGTGAVPFAVSVEIVPGAGQPDHFMRRGLGGEQAAEFSRLEAAPSAKVTFGVGVELIGAAALIIDFDDAVVNPNDLNVYVPESAIRDVTTGVAQFGKTQRMVYWRHAGRRLYVDIVAPQGIEPRYLQFFVVHPREVSGFPGFRIGSAQVYGVDGRVSAVEPQLLYLR